MVQNCVFFASLKRTFCTSRLRSDPKFGLSSSLCEIGAIKSSGAGTEVVMTIVHCLSTLFLNLCS